MLIENAGNKVTVSNPFMARRLAWLITILVWIGILIAYRHQVAPVVKAWASLPSHSHMYFVVVVVAYLAWGKRNALAAIPLAPSRAGIAALLLSCAAAFVGELVSAGVVVQFAVIFMIIATVWAVMGDRYFRVLIGPFSFLLFAVPFGYDWLPTLMDWTANATVIGLRASGVPVYQENRSFIIPTGSWSVVEACAGIRYLISSLFVGSIYAYITYQRWYKRLIFVISLVLLSLFANWMRAYVIVMAAYLTNNEFGLGMSHTAFGWIIFAIIIMLSFKVGLRWSDPEPTVEKKPVATTAPIGVIAGAALLVAVLVIGSVQAADHLLNQPARPIPAFDLSNSLAGLEKVEPALPMVVPRFTGASATHQANYRYKDGEIGVNVGYYRNQRHGAELVNRDNLIDSSDSWAWRSSQEMALAADGKADEWPVRHYAKANLHAMVARVYWVGGWITESEIGTKIFQLARLITGQGDDGAIIVVTATSPVGSEQAKQLVAAFVSERLAGLITNLDAISRQ